MKFFIDFWLSQNNKDKNCYCPFNPGNIENTLCLPYREGLRFFLKFLMNTHLRMGASVVTDQP